MAGRILSIGLLPAVLLTTVASSTNIEAAGVSAAQAAGATAAEAAPASRSLHEELLRPTELRYLDTSLQDILLDLEVRHRIQIFRDWLALGGQGKGLDPVSINVSGIPLGRALSHLLDDDGIAWYAKDHMIVITTLEAARRVEQTTVYSLAGTVDPGSEPDYLAVAHLIESSVFRQKRPQSPRTLRSHRPTKSLVVATNPLEHREIAKLIEELAEAARYAGDEKVLPVPSAIERAIERALAISSNFSYFDTELNDVRADIETRFGVSLKLDEYARSKAGAGSIDGEKIISYRFQYVPLGTALDQIFQPLTWTHDGVSIVVTTKDAEPAYAIRRMYRVADLVKGADEMNDLVGLIRETIAPDSWAGEQPETLGPGPVRKPVGEIAPYPPTGLLVVTQSPRTHRAIATLLDDLRGANKVE